MCTETSEDTPAGAADTSASGGSWRHRFSRLRGLQVPIGVNLFVALALVPFWGDSLRDADWRDPQLLLQDAAGGAFSAALMVLGTLYLWAGLAALHAMIDRSRTPFESFGRLARIIAVIHIAALLSGAALGLALGPTPPRPPGEIVIY